VNSATKSQVTAGPKGRPFYCPRDISDARSLGWEEHVGVRGSKRKLKDGVWELRVDAGKDPISKSDLRSSFESAMQLGHPRVDNTS
jgi:predicted metalloprotease